MKDIENKIIEAARQVGDGFFRNHNVDYKEFVGRLAVLDDLIGVYDEAKEKKCKLNRCGCDK